MSTVLRRYSSRSRWGSLFFMLDFRTVVQIEVLRLKGPYYPNSNRGILPRYLSQSRSKHTLTDKLLEQLYHMALGTQSQTKVLNYFRKKKKSKTIISKNDPLIFFVNTSFYKKNSFELFFEYFHNWQGDNY